MFAERRGWSRRQRWKRPAFERLLRSLSTGALILALVGCNPWGGESVPSKGTIRIGVDLPLSGADASPTTLNGVKFAVQKAGNGIDGWHLALDVYDDTRQGASSADAGVENVQTMIGRGDIGMIGPYTSSLARAEILIAAPAHLAMISPSNTHPCLTKKVPGCDDPLSLRQGNPNNYFRVVTTDEYQAVAMADYFYDVLAMKTVGVLDDRLTGIRFADAFAVEFKARGGAVLRDSFSKEQTSDFRPYLREFKAGGAAGLYVGGTDYQGVCLPRSQMASLGIESWAYGGSDGIDTALCIHDAAPSAVGILSTNVGPDATRLPSAQSAIRDFTKSFPRNEDFGHYTMTAYDATGIVIQAIKKALDAGGNPREIEAFRESVRANVAATVGYVGTTGITSFDPNGDTTLKVISIYRVEDVATRQATDQHLVCETKVSRICFAWLKNVSFES